MRIESIRPNLTKTLAALIELLRARMADESFLRRHRRDEKCFTRVRVLPFGVVMILLLQKTAKSIQRHLHEFLAGLEKWAGPRTVTAGAWTQARAKFRHTAFIELNEQCVLPSVYGNGGLATLKSWHGHRVLAIDGSLVRLPNTAPLILEFGQVKTINQQGATGVDYPEGRMSVVYDVLNRVGLDGRLVNSKQGEIELATEQLVALGANDLIINDRGFTGFGFLAQIRHRGADFLARCSTASFTPAQEMFKANEAGVSRIMILQACSEQRREMKKLGLPTELRVRFVSVRLSTGELEVLVTSLCDEGKYPTESFGELYHQRWGIETYYLMLKSRLDLENWTGETVEAVRQDFHASVLLANLESVLAQPAQEELKERKTPEVREQQVNRSVSYHALKGKLFELLQSEVPAEQVVLELSELFAANPVSRRPDRKVPRRKNSFPRSLHFQRHKRKSVY